ncbi:MAG: hypothetical protein NTU69_11990 [Proteobacteria bacterium]|nr:hypothetical protein [Pseudomonadota bacterium]
MSKKYTSLTRPIKEIPKDELKRILAGVKQSELIRSIILNEKQFLSADTDRSLRRFWYFTVKPVLEKLGLLTESDQTEEGLTRWDAELSRYMAELVRMGVLTYKDLKIVDTSRRRKNPINQYQVDSLSTFGYLVNSAPYPNIIVSTEKDTAYPIIEQLADLFGLSCISGKGQNALAAMEGLIRNMGTITDDIYILTLTDYDPSGYSIAETFQNQADDIVKALPFRCQCPY